MGLVRTGQLAVGTLASIVSLAIAPSVARADSMLAGTFGKAREVSIRADLHFDLTAALPDKGEGLLTYSISPALDYFVVDGLSLGGSITYAKLQEGLHAFSVEPRIGYNVPLGNVFSMWPQVGMYVSQQYSDVSSSVTATNTIVGLQLDVSFLVHPASHFYIGIGPRLSRDLLGKQSITGGSGSTDLTPYTRIALVTTIGGWW